MNGDFLQSLKDEALSRAKHPLAGAYLISWVIWNFKIVIVLFSTMDAMAEIDFIENSFGTRESKLWAFGAPLGTAIAYLLIFPWLDQAASLYIRWRENAKKKNIDILDGKSHIAQDEKLRIEAEILKLKDKCIRLEKECEDTNKISEEARKQNNRQLSDAHRAHRELQMKLARSHGGRIAGRDLVGDLDNQADILVESYTGPDSGQHWKFFRELLRIESFRLTPDDLPYQENVEFLTKHGISGVMLLYLNLLDMGKNRDEIIKIFARLKGEPFSFEDVEGAFSSLNAKGLVYRVPEDSLHFLPNRLAHEVLHALKWYLIASEQQNTSQLTAELPRGDA